MQKIFFLLLQMLLLHIASAQLNQDSLYRKIVTEKLSRRQTKKDSLITTKYLNDTLHFISYPTTCLLDSIVPHKAVSYWELNSYRNENNYRNLYSSNKIKNNLHSDTVVLSKATSGFGTFCPPGYCLWYISCKLLNGTILNVTDWRKLGVFLGTIDNQFDAYLWLINFTFGESFGLPLTASPLSRYKKVQDGYLVIMNFRVSDCSITYVDVLYFVDKNKNVTFIQYLKITGQGGCI